MFCHSLPKLKVACLDLEDALAAFLEWLEVCIQSILEQKNQHPLTRSLVVMWSLWHTNVLIMTQRLVLFMREYEIIYFNIIMCMAPLKTGSFTEHGGVQHFIQLHHQVQLEYWPSCFICSICKYRKGYIYQL